MAREQTLPTPAGALTIRRAAPADLDAVVAILEETAGWLRAKGIDQWPAWLPLKPVIEAIERGECYLARLDGRPAGTLILRLSLQWPDTALWGEVPDDAGYVHSLAVRRAYAGKGLGRRLLDWAGGVVSASGKPYLRLDCMAENPTLNDYYRRAGFSYRGERRGDGWAASLYERPVQTPPRHPLRGYPAPQRGEGDPGKASDAGEC